MAYTFHDLAFDVLRQAEQSLTYQEIWEKAEELSLSGNIKTSGKTPWQTLGARLFVDVRDNPNSKFIKIGKRPTRIFLKQKEFELSEDIIKKIEMAETKQEKEKSKWNERDLHPLLSYFESKRIHKSEYNEILDKPDKYIEKTIKN